MNFCSGRRVEPLERGGATAHLGGGTRRRGMEERMGSDAVNKFAFAALALLVALAGLGVL